METNHSSSLSLNCWNPDDVHYPFMPAQLPPVMVNPAHQLPPVMVNPAHQLPIQIPQPQPQLKPKSTPLGVESLNADSYLTLFNSLLGAWIEDNTPASHRLVKHLNLHFNYWEEEHEIGESIDKLTNLTELTIRNANNSFKSLPNSMATLHNLQYLNFDHCEFEELPANMELLEMNLTHLTLWECNTIMSLPHSLGTLSNLTSLKLCHCLSLTELPPSLGQLGSLKHFDVLNCRRLKCLPRTLCSPDLFSPLSFAKYKVSSNLKILSVRESSDHKNFVEYPDNFDGLDELVLLDIQDSKMKCLPWSITQLSKLRFLLLPQEFALETLPSHLNDSIIISVRGRHVRKTWKQLRLEIGISHFPIPQESAQCPSAISPPVYLKLQQADLEQWICNNNSSVLLVNMLEFQYDFSFKVANSLVQFSNLTHLYLSGCDDNNNGLPDTSTGLRHLSLDNINFDLVSGNLSKLSNLETLVLIDMDLPNNMELPVSLRHVSFIGRDTEIYSLPDSIAKLSNLITLELSGCEYLKSLPGNLKNIHTLKIDKIVHPLPVGLSHLDILHPVYCDGSKRFLCDDLEQCLTQLVNLETLSLTCFFIKSLPSIATLHNLRVLDLKDCFNLKQLPSDVDELIELHTLNISGTRIKSIPDNFMELPKLQCVILSKCCRPEILLRNLKGFITDDTDEIYYEHVNYYDSRYGSPDTFCQGKDAEFGSVSKKKQGLVLKECEQGEDGGLAPEHCAIPLVLEGLQLYDRIDVNVNNQNPDYNSHIQDGRTRNMTSESSSAVQDNHHTSENEQNKNPQNDIEKGKMQKKNISLEEIQQLLPKKMKLVDAAELLGVSRSTLKRRLKELGIRWPSSKVKQNHHAKKRRLDSETHSRVDSLQQMVNSIDTNIDNMREYTIEANQHTIPKSCQDNVVDKTFDPSLANVKEIVMAPQCYKAGNPPIEQPLDHPNEYTLLNIVHQDGNSKNFTVKATYADDTVKFKFCLTYSMEQLKQEVGRRLELEVGTFRIKYEDEDNELIRMSCTSELEGLLRLSRSAGHNCVKLFIFDERCQNGGQKRRKSEEICEPLTVKKKVEKFNLCSTTKPLPFQEEIVSCILPFIEAYTDVKDDGHCGFRAIAIFMYHDEEKWLDVRRDLMDELTGHEELYKGALGSENDFMRAREIVNNVDTPAPKRHWYEATCLGLVVATKYQKICTHWSKECPTTFLPLESRLVDQPPTECINMALVKGNHFIALHMTSINIPLPPLTPIWKCLFSNDVKSWFLSHFKKQFDLFLK